ncbi:FAD-binding domain-containing protein [Aspergillus aurantiobrunneus]
MASYVPYAVGALAILAALSQYPYHRQPQACDQLSSLLHDQVFPSNTAAYAESLASYFSLQEQNVHPACVVQPTNAQEVSTIIETMARAHRDSGEKFAIRSHGHTLFAGAANVQAGVTIDLRAMHGVQLSEDRATVEIGSGASWQQVYDILDPLNVTVAGGRSASIGAGGFLTGGGLSLLGPATGWGCDSVVEYEIVLASGEIAVVNRDSHHDLFIALKGGSNNFGVVTRFTMEAYPSSGIWGGFLAFPGDESARQLEAYSDFMSAENFDPHADPIQSYGWTSQDPALMGTNILLYSTPQPRPPVLQPFVDNITVLYSTLRTMTMADFAREEDSYQAPGYYTLYYTTSFVHSPSVYEPILSEFNKSIARISFIPNMNWYLNLQPSAALTGQNSLGLDPRDERLNIALLVAFFPERKHNHQVRRAAEGVISSIEEITRAAGVYRAFKYLSYADDSQDVIAGYGEKTRTALQAASRRYDPEGLDDGIGSGLALTFHQRNYHVFATARNPDKMANLKDLPNVTLLTLDVCDQSHITAAVDAVAAHTGGGTLDYLVNNAGRNHFMPILDEDLEVTKRLYETNVWGPVAVTQAFAPLLIKARGTVAFITSISGYLNVPYMGSYAGSKRSLELIAETLRLELAPFHVRVLSVVTGAVKTMGQTYFGDFKLPEDSLYKPVEEAIASRAQGGDGNKREDLMAYSAKVVTEITNGKAAKFWCGAQAGATKFGVTYLPGSWMDKGVSAGTGIDVLTAQNRK